MDSNTLLEIQGLHTSLLQKIVNSGPCPLFATVSGAHLYGFPSPDSDIDLRGTFVLPIAEFLRMREPVQTITITQDADGVEVDWVAHDIRKFAAMMTRRNGYVLEQLYSPHVVFGGDWLAELREIGQGCITRQLYHHYRGFTYNQYKLLAGPSPSVKQLLYAYRVLLTGIYVMQTGRIEANLGELSQFHPVPGIKELIERKLAGAEKGKLIPDEMPAHQAQLAKLEDTLQIAFDESELPDDPTALDKLDDFVVRVRLALNPHA